MKLLHKDTYLAMIRGSVGSNTYRHLYAEIDGTKTDITRDGDLSCNFFVSGILWHFRLLEEGPHANTTGFLRDLEKSGWYKTDEPQEGDIVLWEKKLGKSGELHPHTGFYVGQGSVVTNSDGARTPVEADLSFGDRAIEAIYTHKFLRDE